MNIFDQLRASSDQQGEAAARVWWWWRHHYLASKHQPAERDALHQPVERVAVEMFDHVWSSRYVAVGQRGIEPDSIEGELLRELTEQADAGYVPLSRRPDDYVRIEPIPEHDPATVLQDDESHQHLARARALAAQHRTPLVSGGVVVLLLLLVVLVRSLGAAPQPTYAQPAAGAVVAAETETAEGDTAGAVWSAVRDVLPTIPGQRQPVYPVSLEIDGTVYAVEPAQVNADGVWEPNEISGTASWLIGTMVQPIFCVEHVDGVERDAVVRVWDSTGTIRAFRVEEVRSVAAHQIEVLAQRSVGVMVLTCGGTSDRRTLVTAVFMEE